MRAASRSRWQRVVAAGVALGPLGCGGVEQPPRNVLMPSPSGSSIGLSCRPASTPGKQSATTALAFDGKGVAWHGGFGKDATKLSPPLLTAPSILAEQARPAWSDGQRNVFPPRVTKPKDLVPIGGDYWSKTEYFVVPKDNGPWLSSGYAMKDGAATFVSEEAVGSVTAELPALEARYLLVSVGGGASSDVGVELLVPPDSDAASCLAGAGAKQSTESRRARPPGYESWLLAGAWHGSGEDHVVEQALDLKGPGCSLLGRKAVLRIFDFSTVEHVNVGRVAFSAEERTQSTPLWGFADYHAHPTSYLGFGGLQGIHTLWGVPGGAVADYVGPQHKWSVATDIPGCDDPHQAYSAHLGGLAAPIMLNVVEKRTSEALPDLLLSELSAKHAPQGGPDYGDFPERRHGAHQEYHITQIHRAYLGGLRLMSALALQNEGLEYGVGWVRCGENGEPTVDTAPDMRVIRAHVAAMKELAELNKEWMGIAYSPEDARALIAQNKLAVVLGVEVPRLGQLTDDDDKPHHRKPGASCEGELDGCAESVEEQVKELDDLGIRQVALVHGMDNDLGGTAVFQDLYNTVNDWMHRERLTHSPHPAPRYRFASPQVEPQAKRDYVDELSGALAAHPFGRSVFFNVTSLRSPFAASDDSRDSIMFRLGTPVRIVMSDMFPHASGYTHDHNLFGQHITFGQLHPLIEIAPLLDYPQSIYQDFRGGERNQRGLSPRGREFIENLMDHGMLLDMAHMSDATATDTLSHTHDECQDYPLMISHAHLRPLQVRTDYTSRLPDFIKRTSSFAQRDALDRLAKGGRTDSGKYPTNKCVSELTSCKPPDGYVGKYPIGFPGKYPDCDPNILAEARLTRAQAPYLGEGTIDAQNLPREYDISTGESRAVWQSGGVIGLFLGQSTVDGSQLESLGVATNDCSPRMLDADHKPPRLYNDCSGSSKAFASVLLYAKDLRERQKAGGVPASIGVASDFAMTTQLPPRFGPDACGSYLDEGAGSSEGAQMLEVMLEPSQYRVDQQRNPVDYSYGVRTCAVDDDKHRAIDKVTCGPNAPLEPYAMGERTYDFNVDGMANYGLVPDMLQDTENVLRGDGPEPTADLDPVFDSAEGYITMWERARAVAGVHASMLKAPAVKDDCGNRCPESFNHGAPMQSLGGFMAVCDDGKRIGVPSVDACGQSELAEPTWVQQGAAPKTHADALKDGIVHQGDWGIFPVGDHPTWTCGDSCPQAMECPAGTNYVQVRRVLDTQLGKPWATNCNWPALPPENGNRAVVFECLSGPAPKPDTRQCSVTPPQPPRVWGNCRDFHPRGQKP